MKRLLLPMLLLVTTAAVALASLPCKTREEAIAESVVGYILVQELTATGCDALLGGDTFTALHGRIATAYATQVAAAEGVRAGFFRRAYGDNWAAEMARVRALMVDLLTATLAVNPENCGRMKAEMERRLSGGWEPIQERLQRRVDSISRYDKNVCEA